LADFEPLTNELAVRWRCEGTARGFKEAMRAAHDGGFSNEQGGQAGFNNCRRHCPQTEFFRNHSVRGNFARVAAQVWSPNSDGYCDVLHLITRDYGFV
jgi:hypothetical protein